MGASYRVFVLRTMRDTGWFTTQSKIVSIAFGEQHPNRLVRPEFLVVRCIVGQHKDCANVSLATFVDAFSQPIASRMAITIN